MGENFQFFILYVNHRVKKIAGQFLEISHRESMENAPHFSSKGLKLDGLSYDDRSQAVILNKGVPIISKVNDVI
jgi:hypothetical protein